MHGFASSSTRTGLALTAILFAFRIVSCGSRNVRPSSKSTSNASSQARYFAPVTPTIFAVPNGTFRFSSFTSVLRVGVLQYSLAVFGPAPNLPPPSFAPNQVGQEPRHFPFRRAHGAADDLQ